MPRAPEPWDWSDAAIRVEAIVLGALMALAFLSPWL